jgi:hypothetical protein
MGIRVRDSVQFGNLLKALADEIVNAQVHFKLYQDLVASYPTYADEFGQSNTFWSLTLAAHLDATIIRLCKAFDQHANSLNLRNLLQAIANNLHFFDETDFRERLKGGPFVDSLAADTSKPDAAQLRQDIESVSKNDAIVKKLTQWRNKFYAHRDPQTALNPNTISTGCPFTLEDIRELSLRGVVILNRYSNLFSALSYSTSIVGRDDYKSVLDAVRESLALYDAKVDEEWRRLGVKT